MALPRVACAGTVPGAVWALFGCSEGVVWGALRALFGVHYGRCSGCSSGAHSDKATLPNLRQIRKVPLVDKLEQREHERKEINA